MIEPTDFISVMVEEVRKREEYLKKVKFLEILIYQLCREIDKETDSFYKDREKK